MDVLDTNIAEVKTIKPNIFKDARGYFFECFNSQVFKANVADINFCQDNESLSNRGVLRGLHYQLAPFAQTKLVRVVKGKIWDVAVDIRKSSPTFGQWVAQELSEENQLQMFVPAGFAHGFLVLEDRTIVQYKVDAYYSKENDRGIRYDDPTIGIAWPNAAELLLSEKDRGLPSLISAETFA